MVERESYSLPLLPTYHPIRPNAGNKSAVARPAEPSRSTI